MLGSSLNLEGPPPPACTVLGKACNSGFATMLGGSLAHRHEIGRGQILKDSPYSAQRNKIFVVPTRCSILEKVKTWHPALPLP
jgi:hypothetical protein